MACPAGGDGGPQLHPGAGPRALRVGRAQGAAGQGQEVPSHALVYCKNIMAGRFVVFMILEIVYPLQMRC